MKFFKGVIPRLIDKKNGTLMFLSLNFNVNFLHFMSKETQFSYFQVLPIWLSLS